MSRPDLTESQLGALTEISRGGYGTVFRAPQLRLPETPAEQAVKQYHAVPLTAHRVSALRGAVQWRLGLIESERARLDHLSAWPTRIVVADGSGEVSGVTMPLIDEPGHYYDFVPEAAGAPSRRESLDLQVLCSPARDWHDRGIGCPDDDDVAARLGFVTQLAEFLALLHDHGYVYGDLNALNVLVAFDPEPRVRFIDCDAVHPVASTTPNDQGGALGWKSPEEAAGQPLTMASDVYKLSLAIVRIIAFGPRNTQFAKAERVRDALGDSAVDLLARGLARDPAARPSARELFDYAHAEFTMRAVPPTIASVDVDRRYVVEAGDVTVTVVAEHASSLTVTTPDGREVDAAGGSIAIPVTVSGEYRVIARNRFGTATALSPAVALIQAPRLVSVPLVEPVVVGLDGSDFAILRRGLEAANLTAAGLTSPLDQVQRFMADSFAFERATELVGGLGDILTPPLLFTDLLNEAFAVADAALLDPTAHPTKGTRP